MTQRPQLFDLISDRMTHFLFWIRIALIVVVCLPSVLPAQEDSPEALRDLFTRTDAALEAAVLDELDVLAPRAYRGAVDALAEARSLEARGSDDRLVRIQLLGALDDLESARQTGETVRRMLNGALAARQGAQEAEADRNASDGWNRAEARLEAVIRDIERGETSAVQTEAEEIAGDYWTARRESLRSRILGEARRQIREAERMKGDRMVPTLLARAQQAISRAENALTQEDFDAARAEAMIAERAARQAQAMIQHSQAADGERYPREAVLLPYEDLLVDIAEWLGGDLNLSVGGTRSGAQFQRIIEEHDRDLIRRSDSLQSALDETRASLEEYLTESQTNLADAQNKIIELEKRLADLEGARTRAQDELEKKQEIARRVTVAQGEFEPDEALVLQDELGRVVIRVIGIQFASGKSLLNSSQEKLIGKVADAIQEFPKAKILVEGHTDSQGGDANNQRISERRANSVALELAEQLGVPASELTVVGHGEHRPIATNKTKAGRAQNRRIDVLLEFP